MKTTKVYHAPGYPLDPKKEEQRSAQGDPDYHCTMIPKKPFPLHSETVEFTFGSMDEAEKFLAHRARAMRAYSEQIDRRRKDA